MEATSFDGAAADRRNEEEVGNDAFVSVPSSSMVIDPALPLPEMKPQYLSIKYLCKDLFKKWASVDESCFSIETVSGGITNLLPKVSVREEGADVTDLTFRLYGPNTDSVIDRKRELQAIPHLSASGFGAELLGMFGNGMVQSFINACTLSPPDTKKPDIAAEIARQLRKFHQVETPGPKEPQLWHDIFKFLEQAKTLKFDDNLEQDKYAEIPFDKISNEINELKGNSTSLILSMDHRVTEAMTLQTTLMSMQALTVIIAYILIRMCNFISSEVILNPDNPDKVTNEDFDALYVETNTYKLVSHLCWALWAIIQAKVSSIDFDYLSYYSLRYKEYEKQKDACFSLAEKYLKESPFC